MAAKAEVSFEDAVDFIDQHLDANGADDKTLIQFTLRVFRVKGIDRAMYREWLYSGPNYGIAIRTRRQWFRNAWRVEVLGWAGGVKNWLAMGGQLVNLHTHL